MKNEPMIKIDSELGKRIALTSEHFERATIWDDHPKGLYVTQLVPKEPVAENLRAFFRAATQIHTPLHIVAQPEYINEIAREFCYDFTVDAAGTPEWNNCASKFLG